MTSSNVQPERGLPLSDESVFVNAVPSTPPLTSAPLRHDMSPSSARATPRRSRAHHPRLLQTETGTAPSENEFLGDYSGTFDEVPLQGVASNSTSRSHNQVLFDANLPGNASRSEGETQHDSITDEEEREEWIKHQWRRDRDEYDDMERQEYRDSTLVLPFEKTTKRERLWMWISVVTVVGLTVTSIAISTDWIDWPGDGIGQN